MFFLIRWEGTRACFSAGPFEWLLFGIRVRAHRVGTPSVVLLRGRLGVRVNSSSMGRAVAMVVAVVVAAAAVVVVVGGHVEQGAVRSLGLLLLRSSSRGAVG